MITAHKVVAASSFVKNKFKFIKKRVVVIYLGVEDCFFLPGSIPSLNTASISIIFAGQFREGKNQEKLIRAFHQFLLRSQNNSFNLTLPGDGNQRETCRNLVRAINLEKRIFFPGQLNRQEICDLYAKSNISVIPSNVETFGHCIAEPFVLGLCVITSDTGIASDLISDGENGFIFKDFNELVDILVKLDANHDLITQTGQNAYSGHDQLRWQSITEKMVQLYA
jgi:glycosyltransferase involved in cell wall biosynthesis